MDISTWLNQRDLDPRIAEAFGLELDENGWLKIPYFSNGEMVNCIYRGLQNKQFRQEPDAVKCFYNQDVIYSTDLADQPIIITEGEMDAWAAWQAGFERVISVPDGAPNQKQDDLQGAKYDFVFDHVASMRTKAPCVILAVDNDENGKNLLHDLSLIIGRDFCQWVQYPRRNAQSAERCKDLNEALQTYGEKAVVQTIHTAKWLKVDGVFDIHELPPVPEAKVYETGFFGLEDNFKLRLGDFSVVTGIPGMGKSTFVNDFCARIAHKHGLKTAFASFEQHPALDHIRNLKKWHKGKNPGASEYDAQEWIKRHFSFIYPSEEQQLEDTLDLDWFLEKAAAAVIQKGAQVVVLDPWNELEHITGKNQSLTEYVGSSIRRLKRFAMINNVHLMVVTHPTKQEKRNDGTFAPPSLYSISDSAHWANKADIGVVVHREEFESSNTQIRVVKSRYHEIIGQPGCKEFYFNSAINMYEWAE